MFTLFLTIFFWASYLVLPVSAASDLKIKADTLHFNPITMRLQAHGAVELTTDTMAISAAELDLDIKGGRLQTKGRTIIADGEQSFVSQDFAYVLGYDRFYARRTEIAAPPWQIRVNQMNKQSDTYFAANQGVLMSTCDEVRQHYRLEAESAQVRINDYIHLTAVTVYVNDTPILYLPFYRYYIRYSPLYFRPGFSSMWGFWVVGKYHFLYENTIWGSLLASTWDKRGIYRGVDLEYAFGDKKETRGSIYGVVIDEKYLFQKSTARSYYNKSAFGTVRRWKFQLKHTQPLGDRVRFSLDSLRMGDYDMEYDFEEQEASRTIVHTKANLSYNTGQYLLALSYKEERSWKESADQLWAYELLAHPDGEFVRSYSEQPNITMVQTPFLLGRVGPVSVYSQFKAGYQVRQEHTEPTDTMSNMYMEQSEEFMYRINRYARVMHRFFYTQYWYDSFDADSEHSSNRLDLSLGVGGVETIFRNNYTHWANLQLSHTIKKQYDPYTYDSSHFLAFYNNSVIRDRDDFDAYSGITKNELTAALNFERLPGDTSIRSTLRYDMRRRKGEEILNYRSKLSDITTTFQARPLPALSLQATLVTDPYVESLEVNPPYIFPGDALYEDRYDDNHPAKIKSLDLNFEYAANNLGPRLQNLSIGSRLKRNFYQYNSIYRPSYVEITGRVETLIGNTWQLDFSAELLNRNINNRIAAPDFLFDEHRFSLRRRLHCWDLIISYREYKFSYQYEIDRYSQLEQSLDYSQSNVGGRSFEREISIMFSLTGDRTKIGVQESGQSMNITTGQRY